MAYDSLNSGQKATATVPITVSRNENGPVFNPTSYTAKANESMALGTIVTQVTATDSDGVS